MPSSAAIPLNQSRLFKVTSPRRLAEILGLEETALRRLAVGPNRYRQFEIEKKSGGKRPVEDLIPPLKRLQARIAKILGSLHPTFCSAR